MKTIAINETTFETEVLQSDKPALVDLWAPWCGPCRMIAPVVEEIAAEHDGRFKITKVNIDESPLLAHRFGVRSIPTLLFFKDGALCDQLVGTAAKKTIVGKLEALAESQAVA
jgi:thioredoxin 1